MKFHYCSYWHTWSRVLAEPTKEFPWFVEVDLEPINVTRDWAEWNRTANVNIRRHCTKRSARDVDEAVVPEHVFERMIENLPPKTVWTLLFEDILPMIDWNKYQAACNGGASLHKILIDKGPTIND